MYTPSRQLNNFYIRGFENWEGAQTLGFLQVGMELQVCVEADNPYDSQAVSICFGKKKLGYVPRELNNDIALMLYFGHTNVLEARILQIDVQAEPRKQVRVGIYVRDVRESQ